VVFLSPSMQMLRYYVKIRPRPLPSKSFPIHHPLIQRCTLLKKRRKSKLQINQYAFRSAYVLIKNSDLINSLHFRKVKVTMSHSRAYSIT
jgi:hypothetical protein